MKDLCGYSLLEMTTAQRCAVTWAEIHFGAVNNENKLDKGGNYASHANN